MYIFPILRAGGSRQSAGKAKEKGALDYITTAWGVCLLVLCGCFHNCLFLKFMACCTDVNIDLALEISMCGLNYIWVPRFCTPQALTDKSASDEDAWDEEGNAEEGEEEEEKSHDPIVEENNEQDTGDGKSTKPREKTPTERERPAASMPNKKPQAFAPEKPATPVTPPCTPKETSPAAPALTPAAPALPPAVAADSPFA